MVMLHIKLNGITKCSNMVANILPADWGQKVIKLSQNNVMLHIKLDVIRDVATWSQLLCIQCGLTPALGSKGQNSTLSKHGHVAYQNKGNHECSSMVANILPADPPPHDPRDGVNRPKVNFYRTWSCCISN